MTSGPSTYSSTRTGPPREARARGREQRLEIARRPRPGDSQRLARSVDDLDDERQAQLEPPLVGRRRPASAAGARRRRRAPRAAGARSSRARRSPRESGCASPSFSATRAATAAERSRAGRDQPVERKRRGEPLDRRLVLDRDDAAAVGEARSPGAAGVAVADRDPDPARARRLEQPELCRPRAKDQQRTASLRWVGGHAPIVAVARDAGARDAAVRAVRPPARVRRA